MKALRTKTDTVTLLLERGEGAPYSARTLVSKVLEGFAATDVKKLAKFFGMSPEGFAPFLGISTATLSRRFKAGKMDVAESDRIVRFAKLAGMAGQVLGSEAAAREWLTTPQYGLGGGIPLDFARTEIGAREVENLLGRIDHGVYS